jgi:hypothetical protein
MSCQTQHTSSETRDCSCHCSGAEQANEPAKWIARDPATWLIGQVLSTLHSDCDNSKQAHQQSLQMLGKMEDASTAIGQLVHNAPEHDHSLKWALLHILSNLKREDSADIFLRVAAEPVRGEEAYGKGCETARSGEILVRTMAIEGLSEVVKTNKHFIEYLWKLLDAQTERSLRIEIVKAILAADPDAIGRLKDMLPKDLHFALELKHVTTDSLAVDFDGKPLENLRIAPVLGSRNVSPSVQSSHC